MNKDRRNKLEKINDKLKAIKIEVENITSELEDVLVDEENAYDSMPEGLQNSERGTNSEESIDLMYDIKESLKRSVENIDDIVNM